MMAWQDDTYEQKIKEEMKMAKTEEEKKEIEKMMKDMSLREVWDDKSMRVLEDYEEKLRLKNWTKDKTEKMSFPEVIPNLEKLV